MICLLALGFRKPSEPVDPVPTRAGARKDENPDLVKDKIPNTETGQKSQRDEFGLWYAWPSPHPEDDWRGYDAAYYGLYPETCERIADILWPLCSGKVTEAQATLLIAETIRKQGKYVGLPREPRVVPATMETLIDEMIANRHNRTKGAGDEFGGRGLS
jgi:hypothetical protein